MKPLHKAIALLALPWALAAQLTVAPTEEPVGKRNGQNIGGYNVRQSFETGYRFFNVDGNLGKYRSDVNFANGVRLLGSSLSINSREGQGRFFDEILLNTQGLGNDPYQFASFRVQKNKLYRYDLQWRENAYFNPGLTIANGQHFLNSTRRLQDQTITLLPQSKIQFYAGYTRNSQSGPGLSTTQLYDSRGNEFTYFSDLRRQQNEFRLGGEVRAAGLKLFWQRGWEWFKDDPREFLDPATQGQGNNPNSATRLQAFQRSQPWRGESPSWRVNLFSDQNRWYALNGRFTYVDGQRNFILDETSLGTVRLGGAAQNRQFLLFGTGNRPVTAANFTASVFPTDKITVANHTAFHHTRMEGDASYREFNNAVLGLTNFNFSFLGIRAFTNSTDVNYRVRRWLGLSGGYQFTTRRIRSTEQLSGQGFTDTVRAEQQNDIHTGLLGLRIQPIKPLTFNFDGELSRANRPFLTLSERNFHALGARVQYRRKSVTLTAFARSRYNFNSVSLFAHSSRGRHYAVDGSWTPKTWFSLDTGYSKIHLDTLTGLAYFASFDFVNTDRSLYVSNLHNVHLTGRVQIAKHVDLFVGYLRTQDTGDGRSALATPGRFTAAPAFQAAQTFPVLFHSPLFRVSVRLHERVRWNFGYQHYDYNERFLALQNYRAHTGYTSLLWSF